MLFLALTFAYSLYTYYHKKYDFLYDDEIIIYDYTNIYESNETEYTLLENFKKS